MDCQPKLRAVHDADLGVLADMRNDVPLQLELMAVTPRPNSSAQVRDWVERRSCDPHGAFFVIADQSTDRALGFVQLTAIDLRNGHGRLGIALDSAHQGKGIGRAALQQLGRYTEDVLGLRKIVLDVRADNAQAIRMYRSVGFCEVGRFASHFCVGDGWVDVVCMEWFLDKEHTR